MPSTLAHAVAVIYLRLSHETFVSDSMEGQEADCVRKAKELGATEVVIFREVITASKAKARRPEFDAMAESVKAHHPQFLVAWKWGRVSRQGIRQLADVVELVEDTGVRFVSLKDTLDSANPGWVTLASFLAEQAKEEAKNIEIRVSSRQLRDREKGRWMKERPFGFTINSDRHQTESPIRSKNSWGLTTVRHILTSPVTAGYMVHDKKIAEDAEGEPIRVGEGIVRDVEHRRILARLNARKGTVKKPGKRTGKGGSPGRPVTFLLAGFIRCGDCGAAMAGNRRKPPRRSYYRCGASTHGHPCAQGSPAAQNLERLVADRVLSMG